MNKPHVFLPYTKIMKIVTKKFYQLLNFKNAVQYFTNLKKCFQKPELLLFSRGISMKKKKK